MRNIFSPNKTSARLLVDFAAQTWDIENDPGSESRLRFLMVYDLYIKARSYAIINKISFWLAVLGGLGILVWPSIAIIVKDFGLEREFLKSAVVQTTVTGLAALVFAVYSHYKKRQMHTENLMRHVIYSGQPISELAETVLKEMESMDSGFTFSQSLRKKEES